MTGKSLAVVILVLALAACAGDGTVTGPTVPLGPTFQAIQENIFDQRCIGCHSGASAPRGLQLDSLHSYNLLVGEPSVEVPSLYRVDPGNSNDSYIWIKIVESDPRRTGNRMPRNGPPYLSDAEISAIKIWIDNGAQP